jgi:putative transposase
VLDEDEQINQVLNELVEKYRYYGFKKLYQKIRQRGFGWNHKRVYRVYCELGLNRRRKPKKRLPTRTKVTLVQPEKMNGSWSMDFMSDALMRGTRFRTVNILDDCNREALGIKASISLPAKRVTEFLDGIAVWRGYPAQLRVDNGPENISKEMAAWAKNHGVFIHYIQPGKPAQNAYIERFNRTYREEVLNRHLFKTIADAQAITDQWLQEYNGERPHESLGNLTPWGYRDKLLASTSTWH